VAEVDLVLEDELPTPNERIDEACVQLDELGIAVHLTLLAHVPADIRRAGLTLSNPTRGRSRSDRSQASSSRRPEDPARRPAPARFGYNPAVLQRDRPSR